MKTPDRPYKKSWWTHLWQHLSNCPGRAPWPKYILPSAERLVLNNSINMKIASQLAACAFDKFNNATQPGCKNLAVRWLILFRKEEITLLGCGRCVCLLSIKVVHTLASSAHLSKQILRPGKFLIKIQARVSLFLWRNDIIYTACVCSQFAMSHTREQRENRSQGIAGASEHTHARRVGASINKMHDAMCNNCFDKCLLEREWEKFPQVRLMRCLQKWEKLE